MTGNNTTEFVIEIADLSTRFGSAIIHEDINLQVRRGEILALVGRSGCGKSTLLREILLLQTPAAGSIRVFGRDIRDQGDEALTFLRLRLGVLFQYGALLSSLTVLENVGLPLREYTSLSRGLIDELAMLKIMLVGLAPETAGLYPAQLSGGMRKRAALARALVHDPELLFLDEPTAGLDPVGANGLDELIVNLKRSFDLTVLMVTHDLHSVWRLADRIAMLGDRRLIAVGSKQEVAALDLPVIRDFFGGARGQAARSLT